MANRVAEEPSAYGRSAAAEQRVVLHDVSWATFERLLRERGEAPVPRFCYDEGTLEIMSPHMQHEKSDRIFDAMILVLAEELTLEFQPVGSMTCKRRDLDRGLEPDCSYYVQNEQRVRGKDKVDLRRDPPPDLMIEVDISRSSLDKRPVCAALGIAELWLYDGQTLSIFRLTKSGYVSSKTSPTFDGLPLAAALPGFIEAAVRGGLTAMLRNFRAWVRKQLENRK